MKVQRPPFSVWLLVSCQLSVVSCQMKIQRSPLPVWLLLCLASGWIVGGPVGCTRRSTVAVEDLSAPLGEGNLAPHGGGEGFHFPQDKGGAILAQFLPPSDKAGQLALAPSVPLHFPVFAALERPALALPALSGELPRLNTANLVSSRPHSLPEETPLLNQRSVPVPPEVTLLPAGERIRLSSVDVHQPVPLPILARDTPDRGSLDDATADATLAAALAATPPGRTAAAPFEKVSLPEPYEHRLPPPLASESERDLPASLATRAPR
jgi:hypothetical protein